MEGQPGEIQLAVEIVSKDSAQKDYTDILEPYTELKVLEYIAIEPKGDYQDGPVELQGWRRDAKTQQLCTFAADAEGRLEAQLRQIQEGGDLAERTDLYPEAEEPSSKPQTVDGLPPSVS